MGQNPKIDKTKFDVIIDDIDFMVVSRKAAPAIAAAIKQTVIKGAGQALKSVGKPTGMFSIRDVGTESYIKSRRLGEKIVRNMDDFSVQLVKGINENTRIMMRRAFNDAMDAEEGVAGIVRNLKDIFAGMTDWRAKMIARTESAMALNYGQLIGYKKGGITAVMCMDGGINDPDDPCREVDGMIISVDLAMDHLTQHPNCVRSFLAMPFIDEDELEDDDFIAAVEKGMQSEIEKYTEDQPRDEQGRFAPVDYTGHDSAPPAEHNHVLTQAGFVEKPSRGTHGKQQGLMAEWYYKGPKGEYATVYKDYEEKRTNILIHDQFWGSGKREKYNSPKAFAKSYGKSKVRISEIEKGGEGSGNFGHEGRPGEVGGSGEGGNQISEPKYPKIKIDYTEKHKNWDAVIDQGGLNHIWLTPKGEILAVEEHGPSIGANTGGVQYEKATQHGLVRVLVAWGSEVNIVRFAALTDRQIGKLVDLQRSMRGKDLLWGRGLSDGDDWSSFWEDAGVGKTALSDLAKGDLPGHEFRGNQWTGSLGGTATYDKENKQWADKDGKLLPEHIQNAKMPPAWTNVRYNEDPNADLLVIGVDKAGRSQYVYSERFVQQQADAKFARIAELDKEADGIAQQVAKDVAAGKEEAHVLQLIMVTGIRPGSEEDTGAKVQAYGATTLKGGHIVKDGDEVHLHFTGKKGVELDIPVHDEKVATMLLARKAEAGEDGKIFKTSADALSTYTHTQDGGMFKTKDFRTLVGTRSAKELVSKMPVPKTPKEYKASVKQVATAVATRLGNTATVCLQSYISPTVFAEWRIR